jgi:hypothetical protein
MIVGLLSLGIVYVYIPRRRRLVILARPGLSSQESYVLKSFTTRQWNLLHIIMDIEFTSMVLYR